MHKSKIRACAQFEFDFKISLAWSTKCSYFFCIPRNLIFSIVSEYLLIGAHPCRWNLQKKTFLGCAPYTQNLDTFFYFFYSCKHFVPQTREILKSNSNCARARILLLCAHAYTDLYEKFFHIHWLSNEHKFQISWRSEVSLSRYLTFGTHVCCITWNYKSENIALFQVHSAHPKNVFQRVPFAWAGPDGWIFRNNWKK